MSVREFSIVRELSRREVDRHQRRFIGITISEPVFKDNNGLLEWVCDVRVESRGQYTSESPPIPPGSWGIIRNVLLAQWTLGLVADMNVPVLLERSESGRVTIVARSEVRLPEINLNSYSYFELGFIFMAQLTERTDGWFDGFGYGMADPETVTGTAASAEWNNDLVPFGNDPDGDFVWDDTPWGDRRARWE